jgi:hypothetical protein
MTKYILSLRAQQSRLMPFVVIASEAKQSRFFANSLELKAYSCRQDCRVAKELLAMTAEMFTTIFTDQS